MSSAKIFRLQVDATNANFDMWNYMAQHNQNTRDQYQILSSEQIRMIISFCRIAYYYVCLKQRPVEIFQSFAGSFEMDHQQRNQIVISLLQEIGNLADYLRFWKEFADLSFPHYKVTELTPQMIDQIAVTEDQFSAVLQAIDLLLKSRTLDNQDLALIVIYGYFGSLQRILASLEVSGDARVSNFEILKFSRQVLRQAGMLSIVLNTYSLIANAYQNECLAGSSTVRDVHRILFLYHQHTPDFEIPVHYAQMFKLARSLRKIHSQGIFEIIQLAFFFLENLLNYETVNEKLIVSSLPGLHDLVVLSFLQLLAETEMRRVSAV